MTFYFNDEGKDMIVSALNSLLTTVTDSRNKMKNIYNDICNNSGYGIEETLNELQDISRPDSSVERDINLAIETIEKVSQVTAEYEDIAERRDYSGQANVPSAPVSAPVSPTTANTGTSNHGSNTGNNNPGSVYPVSPGHSTGGGRHDGEQEFDVSEYFKPYEEVYSQIPESKKHEYFQYCLNRWLTENPGYESRFEPNFRNVLSQCSEIYDDKGNFCYVYRNGNDTRYFKWADNGILEFRLDHEVNSSNIGSVITALNNGQIHCNEHLANGSIFVHSHGQHWLHRDLNTTPNFCQGQQYFTHGENAGVECTSTALAQCNNINGGSFKTANDYNNAGGITQIGFLQSGPSEIKRYCEENLRNGRATCIYYNYGDTDSSTVPGQRGHCVTVVGSINPGSDIIEELIVIDPASGNQVPLYQAYGFPTGNAKNLFIACETTIHGEATKASEAEGRLPIWCRHGI